MAGRLAAIFPADRSDVVSTVDDRIRAEFYHRIGIADLLPEQVGR
jgi:hypothetical protein